MGIKISNFLSTPKRVIYLSGLFAFLGFFAVKCKAQDGKELSTVDQHNEQPNILIKQDTINKKVFNSSKTMVLHLEKISSPDNPVYTLNYTVLESKTQNVIKKDSYRGTDVRWYDNSSLQLVPYIGMERKPTSENPDDAITGTASNKPIIVRLNDKLN